jgi:hypothetical protein
MRTLISIFFILLSVINFQVAAQIKVGAKPPKRNNVVTKRVNTPINLEKLVQTKSNTYVITSEHISRTSGIHHMYLRQAINNIEVFGTESSIHKDSHGKIIETHNNFVEDIESTAQSNSPRITASEAIRAVSNQMGYTVSNLQEIERKGTLNQELLFNKGGISSSDIPVKLMYYYRDGFDTILVWELSVEEKTSSDWWNFRVNAANGVIVDKDNYTSNCTTEADHKAHDHKVISSNEIEEEITLPTIFTVLNEEESLLVGGYNVFAMPIETPNHGGRSLVLNPDNATASPFGWHDTNGAAGPEYTYTRGNNANAYDDDNSSNSGTPADHAEGGGSLTFNFPLNTTYSVGNQSEDAAVTNLFYWTNIIHDVTYQYGFDEAAGNFQENNYGNGGSGSDSVNAEAQDGSGTCNANFGTPTDGGNPRMQMYTCNDRDGDFDNGVIIHEYGHGISNRLTGGRFNSSCLNNTEQMGEGWSDFFGLILTMEPGDQATDVRGIGTWLIGEDETGTGIRTFAYSTNFGVNSLTYDDVNSEAIPHGVGSVWGTMLWEMTWELIDDHGFSTDFYTVTGNANTDAGNVQALVLVMEGLKLQPCSPGIEDGRDAILLADMNIYGGANQCAIWEAFARRGMGASADQGSSFSVTDGTPAFDLPSNIAGFDNSISNACLNGGLLTGLTGGFPSGGTYGGPGVSNTAGNTYSFNPITAGIGTHNITYTVNDFCNGNSSTIFTETIDVQDDALSLTCPSDLIVESDSNSVCGAKVVFDYPIPEGDLCNRTINGLSQNTNTSITNGLDCTDTASGHLRSFSLGTQGITRDYHIDGIDVGINNNTAGISPITVNIYLASQISGGIQGKAVPLSGSVEPYASATSLVPAGSGFTHNVPMEVFLPAGTSFHVEVISPSSRNNMVAYNGTVSGNPPANETAVGYINCVGADYLPLTSIGFGNLAVLIEVTGAESNEYTTTQTGGLISGSTFGAGTTTNTFMTSAQSGGSTTCSFDVTVIGKTTIYSGGIWSPVVPDVGSNVKFSDNYNTSNGNITACSCEIDAGSTVLVGIDNFLNIYGNITVNGSLIVEHTGSVVQVDDAALVINNNSIAVNLTTPTLNPRDFMIMGSPMTAEDDTMNTAYQLLNHTTANFTPYVGVPPVVGVNFHDQEFDDWSNYTGILTPGEGYLVRPSYTSGGTYNYVYDQGTLNNGVITYPAYFGVDKEDSPNVLSNPYASAIDAVSFINANPIVSEVYFWEHLTTPAAGIPGPLGENFSMEDISMYNLSGGTPAANGGGTPNNVISTGQGFGIKANSAGDVTFNNSMRLTSGNTTLRRPIEKDLIWLTVRDSQYHIGSTTLIGFMETATSGYDEGYDSMKLGTVVSLYSHLEDGSEILGIQGRESFDTSKQIPMGFSTMIDPDSAIPYTISISAIEGSNIELATVYLVDHQENTITNLSEGDYTFLSDAATYNNRFTLQFESEVILGTSENDLEQILIYPNPTQDVLTIVSPQVEVTSAIVYDLRGRVVAEKLFTTQGTYQIDLSKLETAMYFVEITTESGTLTKRVVKQ